MNTIVRHFVPFGLLITLSLGTPQVSYAEEDKSTYLEEIIVTGTKRAASQQDTPIAISTICQSVALVAYQTSAVSVAMIVGVSAAKRVVASSATFEISISPSTPSRAPSSAPPESGLLD